MSEEDEGAWIADPHLLRVDREKITDYLLNLDHPTGKSKAKFFKGVGFSEDHIDGMIDALRKHAAANKVAETIEHAFGVKRVVECFIETPSGTPYCIRSVWNDQLDGMSPKLVTAVPMTP